MDGTPYEASGLLVVDAQDELASRMKQLFAGRIPVTHVRSCGLACDYLATAMGLGILISPFQAWKPESYIRLRREFDHIPRIDVVPRRTRNQFVKSLFDEGHFAVVSRSASDLELVHAVEQARAAARNPAAATSREGVDGNAPDPSESSVPAPEDLLLMVAHDVRSMAATIRGFAELPSASVHPDAPTADSILSRVRSVSERLIGMVDDLARAALLGSGPHSHARQPVRPSELLDAACLDVRGTAETRQQRIERHISVPDEPRLLDRTCLQIALRNLLDNAIRHSRPGSTITVSAAGDKEWLTVTVSDSGPGIAPDRLHTLFSRPASLVSPSLDRGMGLGLWIAKRVAQWHGGNIRVESRPGAGSTFTLRALAPFAGPAAVPPSRSP